MSEVPDVVVFKRYLSVPALQRLHRNAETLRPNGARLSDPPKITRLISPPACMQGPAMGEFNHLLDSVTEWPRSKESKDEAEKFEEKHPLSDTPESTPQQLLRADED